MVTIFSQGFQIGFVSPNHLALVLEGATMLAWLGASKAKHRLEAPTSSETKRRTLLRRMTPVHSEDFGVFETDVIARREFQA